MIRDVYPISQTWDLGSEFFSISDPGAKKAPDPGYRSRNTAKKAKIIKQEIKLFTVPTFSYNKYPYCMLSIERDNKLYKVYTGHWCVLKR
jgi:hypothetical protein